MKEITFHQSELLNTRGVIGGYFERSGGVSAAPYDSLNTKKSKLIHDTQENVDKNLFRALEMVNVSDGLYLQLTGGAETMIYNRTGEIGKDMQHDGAATRLEDVALMIPVADCFPVLLSDPKNRVVGIAHCGWRGVKGGIVGKVLNDMKSLGAMPGEIIASIGPGICGDCYEVQKDVSKLFSAQFTRTKEGKIFLDLQSALISQLNSAGIREIEQTNICTYENVDKLFSARKEKITGRFLALIMQPSA